VLVTCKILGVAIDVVSAQETILLGHALAYMVTAQLVVRSHCSLLLQSFKRWLTNSLLGVSMRLSIGKEVFLGHKVLCI